jgi:hypothetical protein
MNIRQSGDNMNVIKTRNQKIDRIKKNSIGIRFNYPRWLNCHIRKVSTEMFFYRAIYSSHLVESEKPLYQKINYITIGDFCDSCRQCMK